jgi:riboflavin synthase
MFTGIVAAVGRIEITAAHADGLRITVDPAGLDVADVAVGDSIAVNGCCLTVVAKEPAEGVARIAFDVSGETLSCTAGLDAKAEVNLEKALRLADRLGGHLMTGHVDGVGAVVGFERVRHDAISGSNAAPDADAGSWRLEIEAPPALARFIAAKGSIAVHGVSLTVNRVDGARFNVNLIPHTLAVTTLKSLAPGTHVNLEVDLIARYVARLHDNTAARD